MKVPGALGSEQAGHLHEGLLPTGVGTDGLNRSAKNFYFFPNFLSRFSEESGRGQE